MTIFNAPLQLDVYKNFHKDATHDDIIGSYENFTSRSGRLSNVPNGSYVVVAGMQYYIKDYLLGEWNDSFFNVPKETAVSTYKEVMSHILSRDVPVTHLEDLWELGYLPIEIKALEEGSFVPYGVPAFTVKSTIDGFDWLVGTLETVASTENWPMQTTLTSAVAFFSRAKRMLEECGAPIEMLPYMGHDFSFRGMNGRHAAGVNSFGHLAAGFVGTDTAPAVLFAQKYYNADLVNDIVGKSIDATEHYVCTSAIMVIVEDLEERGVANGYTLEALRMYIGEDADIKLLAEFVYMNMLLDKVGESVPLGYVADSFDFWSVVTVLLPLLKPRLEKRSAPFVIRPDSNDPVEILCGLSAEKVGESIQDIDDWKAYVANIVDERFREHLDPEEPHWEEARLFERAGQIYKVTYRPELNRHDKTYYYVDNYKGDVDYCTFTEIDPTSEQKGLIQCLIDIFGHDTLESGYKMMKPYIGAIYGDSITLERQDAIYSRLMEKGIAPTVVLGIGSYSYQYVTRDTHGSAVKATSVTRQCKSAPVISEDTLNHKSAELLKGIFYYLGLSDEEGDRYVVVTPTKREDGFYDLSIRDATLEELAPYMDVSDVVVYKEPKTDSGKNSAKGMLRVELNPETNTLVCHERQTLEQEKQGLLTTVFKDGVLVRETSLEEIRKRVFSNL